MVDNRLDRLQLTATTLPKGLLEWFKRYGEVFIQAKQEHMFVSSRHGSFPRIDYIMC